MMAMAVDIQVFLKAFNDWEMEVVNSFICEARSDKS